MTGYQAPLFFHLLALTSNTSTGTSELAKALSALDACQDGILTLEICEVDPVIQPLGQGAATVINALDYFAPASVKGAQFKVVLRHLDQNCPRVCRDFGKTILLHLTARLHIRPS